MINPPLSEVMKKVDNRYTLVVEVAKRARQLVDGAEPLVDIESTNPVTTAIYEVLDDKVQYEEAQKG